jgi:hypothetical protein
LKKLLFRGRPERPSWPVTGLDEYYVSPVPSKCYTDFLGLKQVYLGGFGTPPAFEHAKRRAEIRRGG